MSQPVWKSVKLETVLVADAGWHYDDDSTITKLVASVQRHGQLQPLVVRGIVEDDSMCTLVHGHKLLGAMLSLGLKKAMAVHVGELDADAALRVALALEIDFETDYARMVQVVAGLIERGVSPAELAAGSPFDAERLKHFGTLAKLDWSVFNVDDGQSRLDWDAPEAEPVPPMLVLDTATGAVSPVVERMVDAAAEVLDRTRPDTTVDQLAEAMGTALEDVTADEAQPATPVPPVPAPPADPAAPAGEAAPQPETAAKPKRTRKAKATEPAAPGAETPPAKPAKEPAAKVPKAPNAQLGLW